MRKHCRTRVRSRGKVILNADTRLVPYFAYLQKSERWREWTFRSISQRQAEMLVSAGEAERITREKDGVVQTVGYRALTPTSWGRPSPATLTFGTMKAVGNAVGEKLELHLSRRERDEILKFTVWPLIGDTKAVAVRPRISEADRKAAERLLSQRWEKPARLQRIPERATDSELLQAAA